jgi:glucokinase
MQPPFHDRSQTMYVGIEIGGTKLQIGLGPGDGTLAALWRGPVDVARGGEGIRDQLVREIPRLLEQAGVARTQVHGVGVGFGGPVDDANQIVIKSHQIEGWDSFPLAKWLTELLGWPVALGNDADVAGLAEALFGAGKGLSPIFYITIGSGIGGGLIMDGEIYRGCGRGAAEMGHVGVAVTALDQGMVTVPLEAVASGWAIERRARETAEKSFDPASALYRLAAGQPRQITAYHVGLAAAENDRLARSILERAWGYLAEAISMMITLQCPRRIIIGGGVSLMGERVLFEPLRAAVAARVFKPFAGCYDIVAAALGEEVVVHGALALARKRCGG